MAERSDSDLLLAARSGDGSALEQLLVRYQPQLWRYAAGVAITLATPAGTTPGAGMYKVEASADGYAAAAARTAAARSSRNAGGAASPMDTRWKISGSCRARIGS